MANNKVVFGNQTIIDMTDATATADDLDMGAKAYDRNGNLITGTAQSVKWHEAKDYVAKNLYRLPDNDLTAGNTTLHVNADKSITISGQGSSGDRFDVFTGVPIAAGNYMFSVEGISTNQYTQFTIFLVDQFVNYTIDSDMPMPITVDSDTTMDATIALKTGAYNITLRPMLKHTSTPDGFEGYFKSNVELEKELKEIAPKAKDAVKWSERKDYVGRNLLNIKANTQTINGVTFTINDDKSITVNGTATAVANLELGAQSFPYDVFFKFLDFPQAGMSTMNAQINDGTQWYRSLTGGIDIAAGEYPRAILQVASGYTANNVTVRISATPKGQAVEPYEPYLPNNREIAEKAFSDVSWSEQNVLGARNLLDLSNLSVNNSGVFGATGSVDAKSGVISFDGTPTRSEVLFAVDYGAGRLAVGDYTLSLHSINADLSENFVFTAYNATQNKRYEISVVRNEVNFSVENGTDNWRFYLWIVADRAYTDVSFKPMLTLASVYGADKTFAPYAMTNIQLTEKVQRKKVFASNSTNADVDATSSIAFTQQIVDATSERYFTAISNGIITKVNCEMVFSSAITLGTFASGAIIGGLESVVSADGVLNCITGIAAGVLKAFTLANRSGVVQIEPREQLSFTSGSRLLLTFVTIGK